MKRSLQVAIGDAAPAARVGRRSASPRWLRMPRGLPDGLEVPMREQLESDR